MITLKDKDTDSIVGSVDEQQLQFLIDQLEEETSGYDVKQPPLREAVYIG